MNSNYWSMSECADFWRYKIGVDPMPVNTRERNKFVRWSPYVGRSISEGQHNEWKRNGNYEDGIAIFPGPIQRGIFVGNYLVAIDIDTKKGMDEFCKHNGKVNTLTKWASKTIVEQHVDDLDKAHIYVVSPIPFPNKGADSIIGIEVKSLREHGIMFCSNSPHINGYRYQIVGTNTPCILTKLQAIELIQHLNEIFNRYGLNYLEKGSISPELRNIIKSRKIGKSVNAMINQGERHSKLIAAGNSILFHHLQNPEDDPHELKPFFEEINQVLCNPEPLPHDELDSIWDSCLAYVRRNKDFTANNATNNITLPDHQNSLGIIERATEQLLENNQFATMEESKDILYYQNGVYVPGGETVIEREVESIFGYDVSNKHLAEIKGHIMRRTYHKRNEFDLDINIINLQNGLYDIMKNELRPHTPYYLSLNQKPIFYDPAAKPKLFGKFLKDVLYPTEIRTAVGAMAYTFLRDTPFEHFFKLFGYGLNGKSVFTSVLTSLHDPRNISNVAISSLLDNRFALSDLEFKDVNIDNELSSAVIKDTSILKKLTGGRKQPIRIERKNQKAYDTYLHAKLFFNTNTISETIDQTAAYYRREIIISFPNTFEDTKDDPHLDKKLSSKEELSGIFNVLMVALRRILRNKRIFLNERTIDERRQKYERAVNPVKAFLEEAVAEDSTEDESITKIEFYNAYVRFCEKYKIAKKSIEALGKDLKRLGNQDGKKGKGNERKNCWLGVRLTPEYQLDGKQQQIILDNMSGVA